MRTLAQIYAIQNQQAARAESQERLELYRQQQQRLTEEANLKTAETVRKQKEDAAIRTMFSRPEWPTREEIFSTVSPERAETILKGVEAMEQARLKTFSDQRSLATSLMGGVMAMPEDMRPAAWTAARQSVIDNAIFPANQIPEAYNPHWMAAQQRSLLSQEKQYELEHPKPIEVAPGNVLINPITKAVEYTAPPKPAAAGTFESYLVSKYGPQPTFQQQLTARREWEAANRAPTQPTYSWAQDPKSGRQVYATPEEIRSQGLVKTAEAPAQLTMLDPSMPQDIRSLSAGSMGRIRSEEGRQFAAAKLNNAWNNDDATHTNFKREVRNTVLENLNVDAANVAYARTDLLNSIKGMRGIMQDLERRGVPTGLVTGSLENLQRYLGQSNNEELVALGVQLDELRNVYRRGTTGIQFSKEEAAQYAKMFPNYTNDAAVNFALLQGLERATSRHDWVFWRERFGDEGAKFVGATNPDDRSQGPASATGTGASRAPSAAERYQNRQRVGVNVQEGRVPPPR